MIYEELMKRLRNCTSDTVEDCAGCPYQGGFNGTYCMNGLISEAADAIEELQNLIDAQLGIIKQYQEYLKKSTWIPVTSALPEENVAVLTWGKQAVVLIDWHRNGKWFVADGVTHWMPLPQPPTDCRQMVTDSNQLIGNSEQLNEPVNKPYKLEE